jgi:hypothetical protein
MLQDRSEASGWTLGRPVADRRRTGLQMHSRGILYVHQNDVGPRESPKPHSIRYIYKILSVSR